ncbi:MAG: protein kinase [Candidatus Omnitrophica bacterium]|nr:protein kinase [Candidatus Omnitrophota bacterium]
MHEQSIIIRDINPLNIKMLMNGKIALFDFDVSLLPDYDWDKDENEFKYTAMNGWNVEDYDMAPEDRIRPKVQTDVFSIGMTLLRAAVPTFYWARNINIEEALSDVERINPELKRIIAKALSERWIRYKNTAELKVDLMALQQALASTPSASSGVSDKEILATITPYFRKLSPSEVTHIYYILRQSRYLGEEVLKQGYLTGSRNLAEALHQIYLIPQFANLIDRLIADDVIDLPTLREGFKANPHFLASAISSIGEHFDEFHAGVRDLILHGFDLQAVRAGFVESPSRFVKQVLGLRFMKYSQRLAVMDLMKGLGDINGLLRERKKVIAMRIYNVSSLNAAEGFIKIFNLNTKSRVLLEYPRNSVMKDAIAQRLPGYRSREIIDQLNRWEVRVDFKDDIDLPLRDSDGHISLPKKFFKYDLPDQVSAQEIAQMRQVLNLPAGRKVIVTTMASSEDQGELRKILDAQAKFAGSGRPLLILGLRRVDDSAREFLKGYPSLKFLERGPQDMVPGQPFNAMAQGQPMKDADVVVLNTTGELLKLYALSDLPPFVGNDRNIAEPISQGKFTVFLDDQWITNKKAKDFFAENGAAQPVQADLYAQLKNWLDHPEEVTHLNDAAAQAIKRYREANFSAARFNTVPELVLKIMASPKKTASSGVDNVTEMISTSIGELAVNFKVSDVAIPQLSRKGHILNADVSPLKAIIKRFIEQELRISLDAPSDTAIDVQSLVATEIDRLFLLTWGSKKYVIKVANPGRNTYLFNEWEILTHLNATSEPRSDIVNPLFVGQESWIHEDDLSLHKTEYIIMNYLEGNDLVDLIRGQTLPVTQVLDLGVGLADTVGYIHSKEVIVRDLKPNNIRILKDGRIVLFDFNASVSEEYDWGDDPYSLKWLDVSDWNAEDRDVPLEQRQKPDVMYDIFSIGMTLLRASVRTLYSAEKTNVDKALSDVENLKLRAIIAKAVGPREMRYKNTAELKADLVALQQALNDNPAASSGVNEEVGGIDLREENLNLDLRGPAPVFGGEAGTFSMPTDPSQIQNIRIDGLVPVILNVTPLPSLPAFLKLSEAQTAEPAQLSLQK